MKAGFIGYARVSTADQSLDVQTDQLKGAGCEKVFAEKRSGASTTGRVELEAALNYCREGDVFVVTRLDRVARSVVDLRGIVDRLQAKGVGFRALQQGAIDTTTSEGRLMLSILGSFAEFELDIRKERQREGIEKAKAEGKYNGTKPRLDPAEVRKLRDKGMGAAEIARELTAKGKKVSTRTVYRTLPGAWGDPVMGAKVW